MHKRALFKNKGAALLAVLATLLVTSILAVAALRFMLSQGTLSHHQFSRTRAYYAAQAGMVYALEMLRGGDWAPGGAAVRYCISNTGTCPNPGRCPPFGPSAVYVTDPNMPYPVQITVNPYGTGPVGTNTAAVNICVDYTPTP